MNFASPFLLAATLTSLAPFSPIVPDSVFAGEAEQGLSYGPRPAYLVSQLPEGPLKERLASCLGQTPKRTDFSIGHRGAPLMFPEHTEVSYRAAAQMGAGLVECDVTFTKDLELVCRHAQNDLHRTTDILTSPLASTCHTPFAPAENGRDAQAECRTSDITLEELSNLTAKMDSRDKQAKTAQAYQGGDVSWRSTLYAAGAKTLTHDASIKLLSELGVKFVPELKAPRVEMPFQGMSQANYAQKLVDAYVQAGIAPHNVWLQSFDLDDIKYWIAHTPEFGAQAVYLDDRYSQHDEDEGKLSPSNPATFKPTMQELKDMGVNYIAPPIWMLLEYRNSQIVPSPYAQEAKSAGLKILTWTLERSGPLTDGGGWYFKTIRPAIKDASAYYQVLDVLAQDVGVSGVFSDWPATVTYYANCVGL